MAKRPLRSARLERADAQKKFPKLNRRIETMENCARKSLSRAAGRFGIYMYLPLVLQKYREWDRRGTLKKYIKRVRKLRPVRARGGL